MPWGAPEASGYRCGFALPRKSVAGEPCTPLSALLPYRAHTNITDPTGEQRNTRPPPSRPLHVTPLPQQSMSFRSSTLHALRRRKCIAAFEEMEQG